MFDYNLENRLAYVSFCRLVGMAINIQCESKNPPPAVFRRLGIFNTFLHTYYAFPSTVDYKFIFNYLQLWWSYAIL